MNSISPDPLRHPDLLSRCRSRLLVIDLQERLMPHISDQTQVIESARLLIEAARILDVPVELSEQSPLKLGKTVATLGTELPAAVEKVRFSAAEALSGGGSERTDGRYQVLLVGVEAHVCVLQTALDLLSSGCQVFIAVDAVGSRFPVDREFALRRMEAAGVVLTTAEAAVFEWCETAAADQFKALSQLVKQRVRS